MGVAGSVAVNSQVTGGHTEGRRKMRIGPGYSASGSGVQSLFHDAELANAVDRAMPHRQSSWSDLDIMSPATSLGRGFALAFRNPSLVHDALLICLPVSHMCVGHSIHMVSLRRRICVSIIPQAPADGGRHLEWIRSGSVESRCESPESRALPVRFVGGATGKDCLGQSVRDNLADDGVGGKAPGAPGGG